MYSLYSKNEGTQRTEFAVREGRISLFGCNRGLIPKLLRRKVGAMQQAPLEWHLHISDELAQDGRIGDSVIVNLKPNKRGEEDLHLYELLDVWGYSWAEWTPVMMRMRELPVSSDLERAQGRFTVPSMPHPTDIYTFLYLRGGVENGQLVGRWTTPGASSTNSVLLWPAALRYFMSCIGATSPELLIRL